MISSLVKKAETTISPKYRKQQLYFGESQRESRSANKHDRIDQRTTVVCVVQYPPNLQYSGGVGMGPSNF